MKVVCIYKVVGGELVQEPYLMEGPLQMDRHINKLREQGVLCYAMGWDEDGETLYLIEPACKGAPTLD